MIVRGLGHQNNLVMVVRHNQYPRRCARENEARGSMPRKGVVVTIALGTESETGIGIGIGEEM